MYSNRIRSPVLLSLLNSTSNSLHFYHPRPHHRGEGLTVRSRFFLLLWLLGVELLREDSLELTFDGGREDCLDPTELALDVTLLALNEPTLLCGDPISKRGHLLWNHCQMEKT